MYAFPYNLFGRSIYFYYIGRMNWKEYLTSEGFMYSEKNDKYSKGYGWGKSITVCRILGSLFEIKRDGKVFFSHFIESFEQFKNLIKSIF